jgi:hypothetical protein
MGETSWQRWLGQIVVLSFSSDARTVPWSKRVVLRAFVCLFLPWGLEGWVRFSSKLVKLSLRSLPEASDFMNLHTLKMQPTS